MGTIWVMKGSTSGIGAAAASLLRHQGFRVIGSDSHDANVVADLTTIHGRAALVRGVSRLAGGRIDAVVPYAGGGPRETGLSLKSSGAEATLGRLPLLANGREPHALTVFAIVSLRKTPTEIIEQCPETDEPAAITSTRTAFEHGRSGAGATDGLTDSAQIPGDLYTVAKQAVQCWCRRVALTEEWAGAGTIIDVVALCFYNTPAAVYVLSNPTLRASIAALAPLRGAFPDRPEEAAALLAWCIVPENLQMTGRVAFADSGYEAQLRMDRAT